MCAEPVAGEDTLSGVSQDRLTALAACSGEVRKRTVWKQSTVRMGVGVSTGPPTVGNVQSSSSQRAGDMHF